MSRQRIISIGRRFGSGGHEIAVILAKRLSLPLYDANILAEVAKKNDMTYEELMHYDEQRIPAFLSKPVRSFSSFLEVNVAEAQFHAIRQHAEAGESFVIVGRCADYVLKSEENVVNFFINGNKAEKKRRILERYDIEKNKVEDFIKKTDKRRASYYNYYTDMKWGEPKNFDLCINTSKTGIDGAVELMLAYLDIRQNAVKHD